MRPIRKFNPLPDLTPLADVAWLIIVFVMLTSRMQTTDPQMVDLPATAPTWPVLFASVPKLQIMVAANGKTWVRIPKSIKQGVLQALSETTARHLSLERVARFATESDTDFLPEKLFEPLNLSKYDRRHRLDATSLIVHWLELCQHAYPRVGVEILGDQNAPYPAIQKVFSAVQSRHVNRFSLQTRLEQEDLRR
jgi:biopolymer transport protein ExbD